MTTIKHVGYHGAVAAGAVAALGAALLFAQFTADAVIFAGEWLLG